VELTLDESSAAAVEELRRTRAGRAARPLGGRTERIWIAVVTAGLLVSLLAGAVDTVTGMVGAVLGPGHGGRLLGLLVGLGMLGTAGLLRLSLWLGPVVLPAAELSWLLPLPVDRRWLLRPHLRAALTATGAAGALLGALGGAVAAAGGHRGLPGIGLAMLVGLTLSWWAAAVGVLAQGSPGLTRLVRLGSALLMVAGLAGPAAGHQPWLTDALAASGPWGWAGWALTGPWPGAALLALAVATAATVAAADRRLATLAAGDLAVRSRAADRAQTGLLQLDLRQITLVAQAAARDRRTGTGLRLPIPRSRLLILPWRDAAALLRRPGRLCAAAALAGGSVLLLNATRLWAAHAHHTPLTAAWLGCLLGLGPYLAAAALVEPAREESDRPARTALLPFAPQRIAVTHLLVPSLLLAVLGTAAATAAATLVGAPPVVLRTALLVFTAGAPAVVATALMGAYRGPLRYELLYLWADGAAPLPFVLWYAAPALLALAVVSPLLWHAVTAATLGAGTALPQFAVSALLATALAAPRITREAARRPGS
jgi:hypothetical protein